MYFGGANVLTHCAGWRLKTEASMFMSGWLVVCTGITVRVSRVKDARGDVHTGSRTFLQTPKGVNKHWPQMVSSVLTVVKKRGANVPTRGPPLFFAP